MAPEGFQKSFRIPTNHSAPACGTLKIAMNPSVPACRPRRIPKSPSAPACASARALKDSKQGQAGNLTTRLHMCFSAARQSVQQSRAVVALRRRCQGGLCSLLEHLCGLQNMNDFARFSFPEAPTRWFHADSSVAGVANRTGHGTGGKDRHTCRSPRPFAVVSRHLGMREI